MPERPVHRHLRNGRFRGSALEQFTVCAVQPAQAQPVTRGHPGVSLERLLQLAQRHPGHLRKLQQIDRVFRRIGRPLPYPFHDHPLFSTPL
ncbi:hypothetical protein D3C72_1083860 [compost metagenome]